MEKTKLAPASLGLDNAALAADLSRAASADDLRSLDDWELVMVGGGDMTPDW